MVDQSSQETITSERGFILRDSIHKTVALDKELDEWLMEGLADKDTVSIRGLLTMMAALQDEIDKLKVKQTSLESEITNLKATSLTEETELKQLKRENWIKREKKLRKFWANMQEDPEI